MKNQALIITVVSILAIVWVVWYFFMRSPQYLYKNVTGATSGNYRRW